MQLVRRVLVGDTDKALDGLIVRPVLDVHMLSADGDCDDLATLGSKLVYNRVSTNVPLNVSQRDRLPGHALSGVALQLCVFTRRRRVPVVSGGVNSVPSVSKTARITG